MIDSGRIVVVAAGFGLWQSGRCIAMGKWTDIARVRAYTSDVGRPGAICLAIQLRDGSEVEVKNEAPGWMSFVNAAQTKLPGMSQPDTWLARLAEPAAGRCEQILFERDTSSF